MHAPSIDEFGEHFAEAQAGDAAAMHELMDGFFVPLTAFFERCGAHDPESSANDALERAIRKGDPERIDSSPAFRAFLYAIARNQAKNEFRSRERRVTIDLVEEPIDLDQSPTAPSAESTVFQHVDANNLLAQVKPEQAEVLELRFIDGFTVKETAELTGKSVPAVNALQRRGLATLRQVVGTIVVVVLVWAGVRYATGQTDRGPVISDDLPSETGELPTDGNGETENGAPLIIETDEAPDGTGMEVRKSNETVEVAGISTNADVPAESMTPQAQLLRDLLSGRADGVSTAEIVDETVSPPLAIPVRVDEPAPVAPPLVDQPAPPADTDDEPEEVFVPWTPAEGGNAQLPSTPPGPIVQPPVSVAPAVTPGPIPDPSENHSTSTTSSTTSTTTTSSTTTLPGSTTVAPSASGDVATEAEAEDSGVIPDVIAEPISDAFGAIKSLVSAPGGWFSDATDAIDISQD